MVVAESAASRSCLESTFGAVRGMALKLKTRRTVTKRFKLENVGHRKRGVVSFKRHGEGSKHFLTNSANEKRWARMLPYGS